MAAFAEIEVQGKVHIGTIYGQERLAALGRLQLLTGETGPRSSSSMYKFMLANN